MITSRCPGFSVLATADWMPYSSLRLPDFHTTLVYLMVSGRTFSCTGPTRRIQQSIRTSMNNIFTRHSPTCRQPGQQHLPYPPMSPKTSLRPSSDSVRPAHCSAAPGKTVAKEILHTNSANTHHSMNPYQGSEFFKPSVWRRVQKLLQRFGT